MATAKTKRKKPAGSITAQTRRASGLIEDMCEHGCGHPSPGWLDYYLQLTGDKEMCGALDVHGCDGCCRSEEWQIASYRNSLNAIVRILRATSKYALLPLELRAWIKAFNAKIAEGHADTLAKLKALVHLGNGIVVDGLKATKERNGNKSC
jgi:hypothetical protein